MLLSLEIFFWKTLLQTTQIFFFYISFTWIWKNYALQFSSFPFWGKKTFERFGLPRNPKSSYTKKGSLIKLYVVVSHNKSLIFETFSINKVRKILFPSTLRKFYPKSFKNFPPGNHTSTETKAFSLFQKKTRKCLS